jgi:hypothetical protein
MYTYHNKQPFDSTVKYNLTTFREVDWDNIPLTIGTFEVSLTKNNGRIEKLPVVEGTLLNVVVAVEKLGVDNYTHIDVIQLTS